MGGLRIYADADLSANEADIRDVLVQAQGESALEEFLRQVKDSWREREFIMVPCGGKCKVIKGWEELFQTIDDQLASIQSMKMSPFFKVTKRNSCVLFLYAYMCGLLHLSRASKRKAF